MTAFQWRMTCAAALILTFAGCAKSSVPASGPAASRPIEEIAWKMIDEGATLVDVRTDVEFQEGHLQGALNIPYDQITTRLAELPADKSRPVVLYCRSGRRSGIAQKALEELGFTNAVNAGGYEAMMRAR